MRPFHILKIAWISFSSLLAGLVVVVGMVAYGMYYLSDPTRGEFFRNLVFGERAFEVTVDLVVEGEPLTMTRKVNCIPYLDGAELKFFVRRKPTLQSFGERLQSGGAVIVVAPPLCTLADLSRDEDSATLPISDDYIPLIRWVDDPDRPTVMEDYVARGYFDRPDARVQYRGMSARVVPYDSSNTTKADELDWFAVDKTLVLKPHESQFVQGYFAWPIPEEEWSRHETIAHEIRLLDTVSDLAPQLARKFREQYPPRFYYDKVDRGLGLVPGPGPIGHWKMRRIDRDPNQIIPLFFRNGAFELNDGDRGYLSFYPMDSDPAERNYPWKMKLRINGRIIPVEFDSSASSVALYSPTTKTVYQIMPLRIHIPTIAVH